MTTVGNAELEAHLSEQLQAVRREEPVIVLDRREPIARNIPVGATGMELTVRSSIGGLHDVPLLGPLRPATPASKPLASRVATTDFLDQLRDERADRL